MKKKLFALLITGASLLCSLNLHADIIGDTLDDIVNGRLLAGSLPRSFYNVFIKTTTLTGPSSEAFDGEIVFTAWNFCPDPDADDLIYQVKYGSLPLDTIRGNENVNGKDSVKVTIPFKNLEPGYKTVRVWQPCKNKTTISREATQYMDKNSPSWKVGLRLQ